MTRPKGCSYDAVPVRTARLAKYVLISTESEVSYVPGNPDTIGIEDNEDLRHSVVWEESQGKGFLGLPMQDPA